MPAAVLTAAPVFAADEKPDAKGVEFFEANIRPVLIEKCYSCHSLATKAKGGLLLDTRESTLRGGGSGPAIVPGKPDESLLYKAIAYAQADLQMPPAAKLPAAQISAIRAWIQMGAPDPRDKPPAGAGAGVLNGMTPKAKSHWAFKPLKKVEVPNPPDDVQWPGWTKNAVDRFVLASLQAKRIAPSATAPRATLIRRLSYDLLGLPPTTLEMKAFVNDKSPDAWEKVVDRMLASPHYGERWGRHWLDSARYSDTTGNDDDGGSMRISDYRFPYAWTYRDYVVKAFNDDKPYNQFLIEQIAADKLPDVKPNDERLAALGFLTVGKRFANNDDTIDERIDALTKSTMGLTVACARCHDHKFDPIPTADYYALHGVFDSLYEPEEKPQLATEAKEDDRVQFAMKLATLESKNRDVIYKILRDRLTQFQDGAEGYLQIALLPNRSPRRADLAKQYKINPDEREIFDSLRIGGDHPVLGPFQQLARVPDDSFADKSAELIPRILKDKNYNPLVTAMLRDLKPQSLLDLAKAYGSLFAKAKQSTPDYFRERSTAGNKIVPVDAAMEQIINTPYFIPAADDISTAPQQAEYFSSRKLMKERWQRAIELDGSERRLLFAAINELRLTEKGATPAAMIIGDKANPRNSRIFIRGERSRLGAEAPRQFLEIAAGPGRQPFKEGAGRLELARAIADKQNPLTARVMVNRVWMYHFGEGFVRSPDDLGNMSETPSHPELLDYLSGWFMERGWSVKQLHKLILMSKTYQQDSETRFDGEEGNPDNRLLWRSNLRRLDFEAIRDSMLQLTGKMDTTVGGQPANITDEPYSYRRSVYGFVDRLNLSDLMSQFDFANPEMTNTKRITTIVPQQALFFMNNALPVEVARQIAARQSVTNAPDDVARVEAIYEVLFQRAPKEREIAMAGAFIQKATEIYDKKVPDASAAGKEGKKEGKMVWKDGKMVWEAKKPVKEAPKHIGTMMMQMDPKAEIDMGKMSEMARNKFAVMKNEGDLVERKPLTPWELYVQALLYSNEFVYVN